MWFNGNPNPNPNTFVYICTLRSCFVNVALGTHKIISVSGIEIGHREIEIVHYPHDSIDYLLKENVSIIYRELHIHRALKQQQDNYCSSFPSGTDPALYDIGFVLLLHQDNVWAQLQLHSILRQRRLLKPV